MEFPVPFGFILLFVNGFVQVITPSNSPLRNSFTNVNQTANDSTDFEVENGIQHYKEQPLFRCFNCFYSNYSFMERKVCVADRPKFQTCLFTKDLINWADVEHMKESEISFMCLQLAYKRTINSNVTLVLGCIGNYEGYVVCNNLSTILDYEQEVSCYICKEDLCNSEYKVDLSNSSVHFKYKFSVIMKWVIIILIIFPYII